MGKLMKSQELLSLLMLSIQFVNKILLISAFISK